MNQYKKLNVWKEAVEFAADIYSVTNKFPSEEKFGLISQLRRAAVSVGSNIAEGSGRNNPREFYHFLGLAYASLCEVETQLIISEKVGFTDQVVLEPALETIDKLQRMIYNLKEKVNK